MGMRVMQLQLVCLLLSVTNPQDLYVLSAGCKLFAVGSKCLLNLDPCKQEGTLWYSFVTVFVELLVVIIIMLEVEWNEMNLESLRR